MAYNGRQGGSFNIYTSNECNALTTGLRRSHGESVISRIPSWFHAGKKLHVNDDFSILNALHLIALVLE